MPACKRAKKAATALPKGYQAVTAGRIWPVWAQDS